MSPFWGSFFENVRGRGRSATLFLVVLAILFLALLVGMIPSSQDLLQFADAVIAMVVVFLVVWFCLAANKARARNRDGSFQHPLSRDELKVARSKLTRRKSPMNVKRR
jgi:fumarate reductase subunit D